MYHRKTTASATYSPNLYSAAAAAAARPPPHPHLALGHGPTRRCRDAWVPALRTRLLLSTCTPRSTERNYPGHRSWLSLVGFRHDGWRVKIVSGGGALAHHLSQLQSVLRALFSTSSASQVDKTRLRQPGAKWYAGKERIRGHQRAIPRLRQVCGHGHHAKLACIGLAIAEPGALPTIPCSRSKHHLSLVAMV